jgi:hypothetical protein
MQFIRNITVARSILRIWDGYFGIGGFFRKDWIYFGLEFRFGGEGQGSPVPSPDPAGSNVLPLRDHGKPAPAADMRLGPAASRTSDRDDGEEAQTCRTMVPITLTRRRAAVRADRPSMSAGG